MKSLSLTLKLVLSTCFLFFSYAGHTQNQPCNTPIAVSSLPYTYSGSTCGNTNLGTIGLSRYSGEGKAEVFELQIPDDVSGIQIEMSELGRPFSTEYSIFLTDICPSLGNETCFYFNAHVPLIANFLVTDNVDVSPGETYYLVVSSTTVSQSNGEGQTPTRYDCGNFTIEIREDEDCPTYTDNCAMEEVTAIPFSSDASTCLGKPMVDEAVLRLTCISFDGTPNGNEYVYHYRNDEETVCARLNLTSAISNRFKATISQQCSQETPGSFLGCTKQFQDSTEFRFDQGTDYYIYITDNQRGSFCDEFTLTIDPQDIEEVSCENAEAIESTFYQDTSRFECQPPPNFAECNAGNYIKYYSFNVAELSCLRLSLRSLLNNNHPNARIFPQCPEIVSDNCISPENQGHYRLEPGDYYLVVGSPFSDTRYALEFELNPETDASLLGTCENPIEVNTEHFNDQITYTPCSRENELAPLYWESKISDSFTERAMDGMAKHVRFTAPKSGCYQFRASHPNRLKAMTLFEECPSENGNCIVSVTGYKSFFYFAENNITDSLSFIANLEAGQEVFWSINCVTTNTVNFEIQAQIDFQDEGDCTNCFANSCTACEGISSESGFINGWRTFAGSFHEPAANEIQLSGSINDYADGFGRYVPPARHTITAAGTMDPLAPIPVNNPFNGRYSIRLGNFTAGAEAEQMSYTYTIDENSTYFTYYYAVVFQDPGHPEEEQPYFRVRVLTEDGTEIGCSVFEVAASGSIPGFKPTSASSHSSHFSRTNTFYKDWSAVTVPVEDYIGQELTVEFITRDCARGDHFGYAYFDATCENLTNIDDEIILCEGDSVALVAPPGFASYAWSNGKTDQIIYTDEPGDFDVTMITHTGCEIFEEVKVTKVENPAYEGVSFTSNCDEEAIYFQQETPDLTIPEDVSAYWVINGTDTIPDSLDWKYENEPGVYDIRFYYDVPGECNFLWQDSIAVYPNLNPAPVIPDTFYCTGDSVRLELEETPLIQYRWDNGSTKHFSYYQAMGNHYVARDAGGCLDTIFFEITERLNYPFTLPNDTTICWYDSLLLGPTPQPNTTYQWSTGETTSQLTAKDSLKYTLTSNTNGCINIDSITVAFHRQAGVRLPEDTALCFGDSIRIGFTDSKNHLWNTGATTDSIYAKKEQWYTLTLNDAFCTESDSIFVDTVTPPQFDLPNTAEICGVGASVTLGVTEFVPPYYSFEWNNGESTPQIAASNPGKYFLTVTDTLCSTTDSIQVNFIDFQLEDFPDTTLCSGVSTITFALPNNNYDSFEWSTGNTSEREETFATADTYFYTATLSTCNDTDFFDIQGQTPPTLSLGADKVLCEDQVASLNGTTSSTNPNARFYWEDAPQLNNPNRTITDTVSGNYILFLEDAYCLVSDTANIQFLAYPVIPLQDHYIFCENDSVEINPELSSTFQYTWSTGETSPSIYIKTAGNYRLDVRNQMCPSFKEFTVGEQLPPTLDIGGALTEVCGFEPIALGASIPNGKTYTWNTGETTPRIIVSNPGEYHLTAFDSICTVSDTTNVIFYEEPDIEAINFTLEVCLQDSFNIILQCVNCNFQDTQTDTLQRWVSGNDSLVYTATTPDGCIFTYRALIVTQEDCPIDIYVPNAFSPNQDGFNDAFKPVSRYENANFADYTLEIYNRWGQRIFVTESHTEGWDGTYKGERVNNGVYVWRLNYLLEGSYQPDELRGTVQVLD